MARSLRTKRPQDHSRVEGEVGVWGHECVVEERGPGGVAQGLLLQGAQGVLGIVEIFQNELWVSL